MKVRTYDQGTRGLGEERAAEWPNIELKNFCACLESKMMNADKVKILDFKSQKDTRSISRF